MKNIKDIEKLSAEDLMRIAEDDSLKTAPSLEEDLRDLTASLDRTNKILNCDECRTKPALKRNEGNEKLALKGDEGRKTAVKRYRLIASVAASIVLLAGLGTAFLISSHAPKDTFDDPRMAYVEIEKTMMRISHTLDYCSGKVAKAQAAIEKPIHKAEKAVGQPIDRAKGVISDFNKKK